MSVIPLTLTISLCLVFTFVIFFLRENSRRFGSIEREALLPLAEETPRLATAHAHDEHEHDHKHDGCGCRDGRRAPCVGCLKSHHSTRV